MILEILNAIAALATIGGFVLEVADRLSQLLERKNARPRMTREEAALEASENEKGLE